jgi:rRNA maturation RNase YbeY
MIPGPCVRFHKNDTSYRIKKANAIKREILSIIKREGFHAGQIDIIICRDDYLFDMNVQFLGHDYYTDVITFDLSEDTRGNKKCISGEIYISIDRIKENARIFKVSTWEELVRVIFHGTLHLCDYKDGTSRQKARMTEREDYHLRLFKTREN